MIWMLLSTVFAAVNINTASSSELTKFNGVGPATADKIIAYREENGPFSDCKQLTSVKGIGDATLQKILPDCTVGEESGDTKGDNGKREEKSATSTPPSAPSSGAGININTASSSELTKFNGVGPATADKIIAYREENGPFGDCSQLTSVKGIGDATLQKILPDCTVGAPEPDPEDKKSKRKK